MDKIAVTTENIEAVKAQIVALDQQAEIKIGQIISTWPVRGGSVTVWHNNSRAAWACGGDSQWGDWDDDKGCILFDDPDYEKLDVRNA